MADSNQPDGSTVSLTTRIIPDDKVEDGETLTEDAPAETLADAMGADAESTNESNLSLEAVYDVPVNVSVVLGKTTMQVNQLLKLGRGAVVELDRKVGEPIDILVNNRLVARGEIVVVEDRIGVTMTEIMKAD